MKDNWYSIFIKNLIKQEEIDSENWLKENERRGNDPDVVKSNEKFIKLFDRGSK